MSSDAPVRGDTEVARYDAFGFRLDAESGFTSKNEDDYVLPDVVQRNRVRGTVCALHWVREAVGRCCDYALFVLKICGALKPSVAFVVGLWTHRALEIGQAALKSNFAAGCEAVAICI